MKSSTPASRFHLMVVIGLMTIGGFYWWWVENYRPTVATVAALVQREAHLRASNLKARRDIAVLGLDQIRQRISDYDRQATHVARLVPAEGATEPTLPLLSRQAEAAEVRLEEVTPLPAGQVDGFVTEGYALRVTGRYHDVGAFLAQILSFDRITQIHNVSLVARQTGDVASPDAPWGVEAELEFRAFATPTTPLDRPSTPGAEPIAAPAPAPAAGRLP